MGFCHVGQAGHELLTSSDLVASASQSVGITGMSHHAQPTVPVLDVHGPQECSWGLCQACCGAQRIFLGETRYRFSLCHPGWSAVVQFRLTETSASQVQTILLPQPPDVGTIGVSHCAWPGILISLPSIQCLLGHSVAGRFLGTGKSWDQCVPTCPKATEMEKGFLEKATFYLEASKVIRVHYVGRGWEGEEENNIRKDLGCGQDVGAGEAAVVTNAGRSLSVKDQRKMQWGCVGVEWEVAGDEREGLVKGCWEGRDNLCFTQSQCQLGSLNGDATWYQLGWLKGRGRNNLRAYSFTYQVTLNVRQKPQPATESEQMKEGGWVEQLAARSSRSPQGGRRKVCKLQGGVGRTCASCPVSERNIPEGFLETGAPRECVCARRVLCLQKAEGSQLELLRAGADPGRKEPGDLIGLSESFLDQQAKLSGAAVCAGSPPRLGRLAETRSQRRGEGGNPGSVLPYTSGNPPLLKGHGDQAAGQCEDKKGGRTREGWDARGRCLGRGGGVFREGSSGAEVREEAWGWSVRAGVGGRRGGVTEWRGGETPRASPRQREGPVMVAEIGAPEASLTTKGRGARPGGLGERY
ncbi:Protein GVQW1 [Plecturocebus cupreus]